MSGLTHGTPLGGVLVGGQSRRFGTDKAAARIGDRSMAARAVDSLRAVADPVVLLGGDGSLARRLALPWRADDRPDRGPLAGLAAGLRWAGELRRAGLVVLACDLPLVTTGVLEALVAAVRPEVDAVVATGESHADVQPLCGWYSTRVLTAVEDALDRGRYRARDLLDGLRVARVPAWPEGVGRPDPLLNVNTREDLEAAIRHAATEGVR